MAEPPIELPKQESFRLVDAGKAPRAPLRYALAAGTTAIMARTALASRHLENGSFTPKADLPGVRDGFEIAIAADHRDRLALRALPAQAAAASPQAAAYLAPWRSLIQDRRITAEIDARGAIGALRFDDDPTGARSAQARDEVLQRLMTLNAPLPDEPVGIGASWRVVTILRQGPVTAKQTATYTLLARGARRWKLHVKLQRVGQQQAIVDPSLPRGATAELVAMFRALEGDIDIDPQLPLVVGGGLTVESRLHARIQLPAPAKPAAARPPVFEQMFEDTGRLGFSRCRPAPSKPGVAAATGAAAATGSAAATAAAPAISADALAACPDGFSPSPQ